MARFMGEVEGNRNPVHRLGSPSSGIRGHIHGWRVGIEVRGYVKDDEDVFDVYLTSGSAGHRPGRFLGTFSRKDLE